MFLLPLGLPGGNQVDGSPPAASCGGLVIERLFAAAPIGNFGGHFSFFEDVPYSRIA